MKLDTKTPNATSFRPDIQGLRAIAVGIVVAYHAGFPGVDGGFIGVDLFFVLSGYLIIGLMTAELGRTGSILLPAFWARRARRLFPASALVIVTTVVAAKYLVPFFERKEIGIDAMWASLFSANWRFALQGTDYLAADRSPSPLLHFWSLGVEEQFYIITPLLFASIAGTVAWRNRRAAKSGRAPIALVPVLSVVLTVIVIVSLAYCVYLTQTNQPFAFFGTHARAWQLGAGGLLAIAVPRMRAVSLRWGTLMSAAGLALLVGCTVLLSESGTTFGFAYPSWLAIGPTLSGLLLIAGGLGGGPISSILSTRPFTFVGDISYSLYLWHWPLLVLGPLYLDSDRLRIRLLLVAIAFVLAVLTYYLLEDPIRRSKMLRASFTPIVSIALGAVFIGGAFVASYQLANQTVADIVTDGGREADAIVALRPSVEDAPTDEGVLRLSGCQLPREDETILDREDCLFGDVSGDRSVVLLGDSIASAVFPPLEKAARDRGWQLTGWAKAACTLGDFDVFKQNTTTPWPGCAAWREDVLERTLALKPDAVVIANSGNSHNRISVLVDDVGKDQRDELIQEGLARTVERFTDAGIRVILVESPHRAPYAIPECLLDELSISACTYKHRGESNHTDELAARHDDIIYVESNDVMCKGEECFAAVDGMITFRDFLHFTKTFGLAKLTPMFDEALAQAE